MTVSSPEVGVRVLNLASEKFGEKKISFFGEKKKISLFCRKWVKFKVEGTKKSFFDGLV